MYFGLMPFRIAGPANTARGVAADRFQKVVDSLCTPPAAPVQPVPATQKETPDA